MSAIPALSILTFALSILMRKNFIILLAILTAFSSCGQTKKDTTINGLTIDPGIKTEVEKHIEDSKEFDAFKSIMQVYANPLLVESYENDTLSFSSTDVTKKTVFKSFYAWRGDTLSIDGAYGLFGGTGFCINIKNKEARLFHMLSSDDFPTYAYKEKDSLLDRLEVPCTNTKIVLSEIPDSTKKQIIYGYVALNSSDFYYTNGSENGHEILPRTKARNNMKIYFRSGYFDFKTK